MSFKDFLQKQAETGAIAAPSAPFSQDIGPPQKPQGFRGFLADGQARAEAKAAMVMERFRDTTSAAAVSAVQNSEKSKDFMPIQLDPSLFLQEGKVADMFRRAETESRLRGDRLASWASKDPVNAVLFRENGPELNKLQNILHPAARGADSAITGGLTGFTEWRTAEKLRKAELALEDKDRSFGEIVQDVGRDIATDKTLESGAKEGSVSSEIRSGMSRTIKTLRFALSRPVIATGRYLRSREAEYIGGQYSEEWIDRWGDALAEATAVREGQAARRREMWPTSAAANRGSTTYSKMTEGKEGWAKWRAFADFVVENPGEAMALSAETTVESLAPVLAGALTTMASRNPLAGVAVAGTLNVGRMADASSTEVAAMMGYTLSDPEDVKKLIADPEARYLWRDRAKAYTLTVAAVDALSQGAAGQQMAKTVAGEMFLQGLTQAAMGSGGEVLGRLMSGQEQDPLEIVLEGLGELMLMPVEVFGVAGQSVQKGVRERMAASEARGFFEALTETATDSDLRRNVPAKYREIVTELTKNGPVETVEIDSRSLPELFQSGAISPADLVATFPSLTEDMINEAINEGRDLVIPTSDYATYAAGKPVDKVLRQHMRLKGSMTAAEMAALETGDAMAEFEENLQGLSATVGKMETEIEDLVIDLRTQIEQAGEARGAPIGRTEADANARHIVTMRAVLARQSNMSLTDYLKQYPLPRVFGGDAASDAAFEVSVDRLQELRGSQSPEARVIEAAAQAAGLDEQATNEELAEALREYAAEPVEGDIKLNQSVELRRGTEDLSDFGLPPGTTVKTRDLAKALAERTVARWGQVDRNDQSEEAVDRIASMMADEVEFEATEVPPEKSALGWYSTKREAGLDILGETMFPELLSDREIKASSLKGVQLLGNAQNARDFLISIMALTSDGTKVQDNLNHAIKLYARFRKTGKLPLTRSGGDRGVSMNTNINVVNRLLAEKGPRGMHDYLLQKTTVAKLRAELRKEGVKKPLDKMLASEDVPYAVALFGPKLGAFYANLMGEEGYLTMDRWWTRTFNRMRGDTLPKIPGVGLDRFRRLIGRTDLDDDATLIIAQEYSDAYAEKDFKKGTEAEKAGNTIAKLAFRELQDAPYNASDRSFMIATAKAAVKKLKARGIDITIADMQAVLWYYEKRLYGLLGARPSQDISFEEAARHAAAKKIVRGIDRPGRQLNQGPIRLSEAGGDRTPVTAEDLGQLDENFFARPGWAVLTSDDTGLPDSIRVKRNTENYAQLKRDLEEAGIPYREVLGHYGSKEPENSVVLVASEAQAVKLGRRYGQDSVLTPAGLVYTVRERPDTPPTGNFLKGQAAIDQEYYTEVPGGEAFALELDFGKGPGNAVIPPGYKEDPSRPQLPIREADGMVEIYHYSEEPRTVVDPEKAGTSSVTSPQRKRGTKQSYWGVSLRENKRAPGTGYVKDVTGEFLHKALVDPQKLYPLFEDPDNLRPERKERQTEDQYREEYEAAIREAGYDGFYVTDDEKGRAPVGNVVAMFRKVPVKQYDGTLESLFDPEEIVMPIDPSLPVKQQLDIVEQMTAENVPIINSLMAKIDKKFGTESGGNVKELSKVAAKAKRPSVLAKKPWHTIAHIRDSYRFKTPLARLEDVPGIFELLLGEGIEVVKSDTGKLFSPGEWGWRIIVFDLRMPNGQLVEYYLPLQELEVQKKVEGHLIFEEWRSLTEEEIAARHDEYMAALKKSFEGYEAAFDAALSRIGTSRPEAEASWAKAEKSLSEALLKSASSSGITTSLASGAVTQSPDNVRVAENDPTNNSARDVPSSTSAKSVIESSSSGDADTVPSVARDVKNTPAFKKWFGKSKVVDESGQPLVMYHGTDTEDFSGFRPVSWFTTSPAEASAYSFAGMLGKREKVTGKYITGSAAELAGERLPYRGILNDTPKVEGEVYATDEGVARYLGKGRWELITDLDVDYGEGSYDPNDETIRVEAADRSQWAADKVAEYEAYVKERFPGGEGGRVIAAYLSIQNPVELPPMEANRIAARMGTGDEEVARIVAEYEAQGYDGVVTASDEATMFPEVAADLGGIPVQYIAFKPEQVKSVFNEGTFDPNDPLILKQENRGSIILPPTPGTGRASIITLFKNADLSTILHEGAHDVLYTIEQMIKDGNATQQLTDDFATLKAWWTENADAVAKDGNTTTEKVLEYLTTGTTGDRKEDLKVYEGLQEQFARGHEAYLFEGKAPSKGLQRMFDLLSAFLVQVYKDVRKLDVILNDEVRGVFDRLVATEEEISKAKAESGFTERVANTAEELGVSEEEWAEIMRLSNEAQDDAKRELLSDIMRPVKAARDEEYLSKKKALTEEVRLEVAKRPVNRVREWLGNSRWIGEGEPENLPTELRMDRDMLLEDYGSARVEALPRGKRPLHAKDTGLSADEVAGWFGFESGDSMLTALQEAPKMDAEVKRIVDERLRTEAGDPLSDGTIAELALDAIHGEARGRLIEAELKALSRNASRRTPRTSKAQIREMARRKIASMPVRQAIRTGTYRQAMERAGENAQRALAKGDRDTAYDEKRKQLLNHAMFMESKAAAEMTGLVERRVARLKKRGTRKNIEGEYLSAIDEILDRYDFRKITSSSERRRGSLQAYIQMMKDASRENELAIPASVMNEAQRRPYKAIPVRELEDVRDALTNIEHTGRRKQALIDAQNKREWDQTITDLIAEGDANIKDNPGKRTSSRNDRIRAGAREFFDLVLNADTLLRKLGGFDRGKWYDILKEPIDDAANQEQVMRGKAADDIDALYTVYSKGEVSRMTVDKAHPQLKTRNDQKANFTKWELVSMALNMGNEDNLNRLMDRDNGYGYTKGQVDYIKGQLNERDWAFVQSVWDYINTYWPQIAEREKRQKGVAPTKVEAVPVETPYGTFEGGYYPIKYDTRLAGKTHAEEIAELQTNTLAGRFGKAHTRDGHTEARAGGSGGRVLQLGMGVFHQHVAQVIHDLAFSEAVNNTWRVLQDPRVVGFFERKGLLPDHQSLELWIQDTATGPTVSGGVFGKFAVRLKNTFTLSKLGFNIATVMIQMTGVTQSMVQIGKVNFAKGVIQYASNMPGWVAQVKDASPFMAERETTFHRDIYDLMGDTMQGPLDSKIAKWQRGIGTIGLFLMQKVQFYGVDMPTWLGAYQQGLQKFGNDEVKARKHADRMVARAQASGLLSDRSAFERGTLHNDTRMNGFVRLFTTLGSYMFAKGNIAYERVGKARQDITGLNAQSAVATLSLTFDLTLLFTLEAVLYNLIKGTLPGLGDDDEDEKLATFLAKETAFSILSTMPVGRDVSSALGGFGGGGAYGSISETMAGPLIQAAQGEVDMALAKTVSNAVGLATGLPSGQLNRMMDAWWREAQGDDVAPVEYLMGRR